MSAATIKTFKSYADALAFLDGRNRVKIGHNTELVNDNAGTIGIRYHATVIVAYKENGTVTFNTGGWDTMTTFGRMDQVARHFDYTISRHKWESYIQPTTSGAERVTGWEVVSILPDGTLNVRK